MGLSPFIGGVPFLFYLEGSLAKTFLPIKKPKAAYAALGFS
ncbi:hypothetical protein ISR1_0153 [Streptococcus pyogenes]|nr:hypothetial protein [Streptococcus pyogenes]SDV80191.1 hypothetical protein ISR1_0153 [Streptococcus pyogenes]